MIKPSNPIFKSTSMDRVQFLVNKIEDGYRFVLFNELGNESSYFSINEKIIDEDGMATGYDGNEGVAIEIFRKHNNSKK